MKLHFIDVVKYVPDIRKKLYRNVWDGGEGVLFIGSSP